MSIEQTSQLLHLILNSLLLSLICYGMAVVSRGRMHAMATRLHLVQDEIHLGDRALQREYIELLVQQRRSLRQCYRWERLSLLTAHYALLLSLLSAFVVSLRSLLNWNVLIEISLVCFVGSLGLGLFSVLCVLTVLHHVTGTAVLPLSRGGTMRTLSASSCRGQSSAPSLPSLNINWR